MNEWEHAEKDPVVQYIKFYSSSEITLSYIQILPHFGKFIIWLCYICLEIYFKKKEQF